MRPNLVKRWTNPT